MDKVTGSTPRLLVVNMESATGLYSGKPTMKNKDIGLETIMACSQWLLNQLHAVSDPEAWFANHSWSLQAFKPKPEAYERATFKEKTRNICALNASVTPLLNLVQKPIMGNRPSPTADDATYHDIIPPGNYNVQGFSPVEGYFQQLIRNMRNARDNQLLVLFMADNLFLSQKLDGQIHWLSLDGEKMECSHNSDDVRLYIEFFKS